MHRTLSKYLFYLPATRLRGERVLDLLPEKRANAKLDAEQLSDYQVTRLRHVLTQAKANSAFYAETLDLSRMPDASGDNQEFFDWYNTLPFITKQDIIDDSARLRTGTNRRVSSKTTGGSTGEPVQLWKNAEALAHERSATWRAYEWAGVSIGDPQLRFWGIPLSATAKRSARLIDIVANRRRISAFDLTEASLARHHDVMLRFKPTYLYGYASVIRTFAEFVSANRLAVPSSLRSVITTSEVLTPAARDAIESGFSRKVFNEYGCGEVGSVAHECAEGHMHIMADNVYLELDQAERNIGEIVVTDLHNTEMPLIRYRLGDFASWDQDPCPCGVTLPQLSGIHGRAYDTIVTSDGRSMHPESVMYIFEDIQARTKAFRHFQAIQQSHTHFDVRIVPTDHWSNDIATEIDRMLKSHIANDVGSNVTIVDRIEREKSGKIRVVKSQVAESA